MLTISLERLSDLLEKAAEVDLAVPAPNDPDEAGELTTEQMQTDIIDDPAYQDFRRSLTELSPGEQYELIALALVGRSDGGPEDWPEMLEQARAFREENIVDELTRIMVLSDEIEAALDRLGIGIDEDQDETLEEHTEGESP